MSKQTPVIVVAAERSLFKKVLWLLVVTGLFIYIWQSPAEAAAVVRTVIGGLVAFIDSL